MSTNGRVFLSGAPKTKDVPTLPSKAIHQKPFDTSYGVFNMMVYGEVGEGKTPLLGSVVDVPEMCPALLIDCDDGTLSLRSIDRLDTIHIPELAAILTEEKNKRVDEWGALEEVYKFLCYGDHEYKTCMVDGGTDLERFCENNVLSNPVGDKRADRDLELAELGDFRRIQERMKRMYTKFRDLRTSTGRRMNFIAAAHEAKGKDPITLKPTIQPMFLGKGAVLMPSRFDIVARLVSVEESNKTVKYLIPSLEGRSRGRDRSRSLGSRIQDPTMEKIYNKIFAKQEVK